MKTGDKVTLKEGLEVDCVYGKYGGLTLCPGMYNDAYRKELTVKGTDGYYIEVEESPYHYNTHLLKPIGIWTDRLEAEKELELLLSKYKAA